MITVSQIIGNVVGKGAEFKADETVVEMGFGRQLRNALRIVVESGNGERQSHWRDRLVTAHPPARTRVARLEAHIRRTHRDQRR
jgi:Zn-dependent protease with chaperone function